MKTSLLKSLVVLTLASVTTGFSAAVVSYVGTVGLDEAQAWRDNTVAKTYDVGGTNTYGNAGYLVFGTKTDTSGGSNIALAQGYDALPDLDPAKNIQWTMPSWIRTTGAGLTYVYGTEAGAGDKYVFNFGGAFDSSNFSNNPSDYPVINNPLNSLANERVGVLTTASNTLTNVGVNFVNLRFETAGSYRLGLLANTLDSTNAMDQIGIWNGVSYTSQSISRSAASLAFFDVTAQAGDVVDLAGFIGGTAGRGALSYLTLDVVPEPSVWHYLTIGLAGVIGLRLRRRCSVS